jgi:xanthine dehydrogenase accessory factor
MNSFDNANKNILDFAQVLTESGEPFAYATIIRTAGATSAKPGAKAIVSSDGQILKDGLVEVVSVHQWQRQL